MRIPPHVYVAAVALLATAVGAPLRHPLEAQLELRDDTQRRPCDVPRPRRLSTTIDTIPHCLARVQVFGDANLKDVLGAPGSSAIASGALGLNYAGSRFIATGVVNVAGTSDTVRAGYGSSLLAPAAGKGLNAGSLVIRARAKDWRDTTCAGYSYGIACNMGIRAALSASTRRWATRIQRVVSTTNNADTVDKVLEVSDVPILGASIGAWYSFFDGTLGTSDSVNRPVGMVIDAGYVMRSMRGDLTSGKRDAVRSGLLGSDATRFSGWETGLTLIYDQIRSNFTYYYFGNSVDGLSRGQIVATVELRAALASGLLRRN